MEATLTRQKIPFAIKIIEQANNLPFNKGILFNVGYLISQNFDYYCFHDIDMLPIQADYSYSEDPIHLAVKVEQFGWKLPYETFFGGVTIYTKTTFEKINGFSQRYWGWGGEDDEMYQRCLKASINIERRKGIYRSLSHDRPIDWTLYTKNLEHLFGFNERANCEFALDGLKDMVFSIKEERALSGFSELIKVDFY
jgi:predicted glycosyltransferase involved in capsule biosynthesis